MEPCFVDLGLKAFLAIRDPFPLKIPHPVHHILQTLTRKVAERREAGIRFGALNPKP